MTTITLTVNDDGMVRDIKRACQLLRGVDKVKVDRHDITKTRGYQEAMEDLEAGRVTHWDSPEDFFKKMREDVQSNYDKAI